MIEGDIEDEYPGLQEKIDAIMEGVKTELWVQPLPNADPKDWATHEIVFRVTADEFNVVERRLALVAHRRDGVEIISALAAAVKRGEA